MAASTDILTLPVVALHDTVIFPGMVLPVRIGRAVSVRAVEAAQAQDGKVLLVAEREQMRCGPLHRWKLRPLLDERAEIFPVGVGGPRPAVGHRPGSHPHHRAGREHLGQWSVPHSARARTGMVHSRSDGDDDRPQP